MKTTTEIQAEHVAAAYAISLLTKETALLLAKQFGPPPWRA